MTEPTPEQIERVAVAIAVVEIRKQCFSEELVHAVERVGRQDAVQSYGDYARAAISAYLETAK